MSRLDCRDETGLSLDVWVSNGVQRTQICADANVLYQPRKRDHSRCTSEGSRKVECATRDRLKAESLELELGAHESSKKKTKDGRITNTHIKTVVMNSLVVLDDFQLLNDSVPGFKTGFSEVVRLKFVQHFLVELRLGKLEDSSEF